MRERKRDRSKEREQAIIDRAERIFALRLTRMLNADGALLLEPSAGLKSDAETPEIRCPKLTSTDASASLPYDRISVER
jgi:hypothetical protein